MKRALDIAIALALFAGSGCGDSPCGACPTDSVCEQVPSGNLTTQRWECRVTVKVIDRKWLLEQPQQ